MISLAKMNCDIFSVHLLYFFFSLIFSSIAFTLENYRNERLTVEQIDDIKNTTKWKLPTTTLNPGNQNFDNTSQLTTNQLNKYKIQVLEDSPCQNPFTGCTSTASTVSTTVLPPSNQTFPSNLDVESDANLPADHKWELPNKIPKWMEYYVDYQSFLDLRNNTSTCASLISSLFTSRNLPNVPGIWSTCRKSLNCDFNPSSCHPSIHYTSPDDHYIHSIKSKFHLQNTSVLRLHVSGKCWDYRFQNEISLPCTLILIPPLGDRWHAFGWGASMSFPNEKVFEFRLELISQSSTDVVLLDTIEVQYKMCNSTDNCSSRPTNPPELTSTSDPATTEDGTITTNCDTSTTTTEYEVLQDSTTNTAETSGFTDSIETTTTTICTTRTTRTTTRRSGSSIGPILNTFTIIIAFIVLIFK